MRVRRWMARLLKTPRLLKCAPALLVFTASTVGCAQEATSATETSQSSAELPFVAATPENIMDAVQACEKVKDSQGFETSEIRSLGWRQISPPRGLPEGQSMFANRPSGASITIGASEAGPDQTCVIIGWVDSRELAESISSQIASEYDLALHEENDEVAKADRANWTYTIAMLTKPDVTSQIRMIVVITPTEDGANS